MANFISTIAPTPGAHPVRLATGTHTGTAYQYHYTRHQINLYGMFYSHPILMKLNLQGLFPEIVANFITTIAPTPGAHPVRLATGTQTGTAYQYHYTRRQINLYGMFYSHPLLMKFCKDYFRVTWRLSLP